MKYIKSLLHLKKNRELPKEILYSKMGSREWSDFKDRERDKITDLDISEIKRFLVKVDVPCKHGKMCPTCPDAIVYKKNEMKWQSSEIIEIKRAVV